MIPTVHVEFISDYICPWCYVGKVRLERLKAQLAGEIALNICIRPYILYPHIPKGGLPKSDFAKKTKPGMGRALRTEAKAEGIEINYRNIERIPCSLEAHRLTCLIEDNALQYTFAKRIFYAYFEQGQDIEQLDFLVRQAEAVGLSPSIIQAFQETDAALDVCKQRIQQSKAEYINVVPSIKFDKKFLLPGLQSAETWENFIRRAAHLQTKPTLE